jgi:heme/copper-type cytochrome/quinol oxidase subunit 3
VFVTLIAARYLTAGGNIGPWSEWLGVVATILAVLSGVMARAGRQAIVRGDNPTMARRLRWAFWLGVALVACVWLQYILFGQQAVPVTLPTAEVYYVLTGIWMLFAIISGFALWAAPVRGRRIGGYTVNNHWDVDAATYFWMFTMMAWVVVWAVLYLI